VEKQKGNWWYVEKECEQENRLERGQIPSLNNNLLRPELVHSHKTLGTPPPLMRTRVPTHESLGDKPHPNTILGVFFVVVCF
jgi:hypothetical protein